MHNKSIDKIIALVGEEKAQKMLDYMDAILEMNQHINLTGLKDRDDFISKNLLDSLSCVNLPEFQEAYSIIDIGTGAGFPGVPLAIAFPEKEFILVDSLNKRLKIIRQITDEMGIDNVFVVHARAEEAATDPDFRDSFDICVSRAVASLDTLAEWCLPFVMEGGFFISYKGARASEEIDIAKPAIKALGGKTVRLENPIPDEEGAEDHTLVIIKKLRPTPKKFPRRPGDARKNPIR